MPKAAAGPEIERLIQLLARLPGLGPRSARRAALHLIKKREPLMAPLAAALQTAIEKIEVCQTCGNIDTPEPCTVCTDPRRDRSVIVVVADVADLWALERAAALNARYHVLGGTLSPLDGIGPQDLTIDALISRAHDPAVKEIDPGAQRHGRRPDHGALHHRPAARRQRDGDAARARRAGRRRARLSRRRHAVGGDPQPARRCRAVDRRVVQIVRVAGDSFAGAEPLEMPARLQPPQQHQARQRHDRAEHEEPGPAGRFGDEARAGRQISAADRGERGQQRVLRRGVQRRLAQRREIGDEDHRADRAGEILHVIATASAQWLRPT